VLIGAVLLGIALGVPEVRISILIQLAMLEGSLLVVWLLLKRGHSKLGSAVGVASGWLIVMGASLLTGGVTAANYVTFAVLLVAAGLLLGTGGAVVMALLTLLIGALSPYLTAGPSALLPTLAPQAPNLIRVAFAFLFIIIFLAVAQREMHSVVRESARSLSILRATLESTADGILVVDSNGKVAGHNQKFLDLWRIPPELAAAGDDARLLAHVVHQLRDPGSFARRVKELYDHPDAVSSDTLEFQDGRVFERYSQPQKLDGESVGRVWSFRDVTEANRSEQTRRSLELALFQSQKMEALGRLAGGIAHDFNNILTAIMSYSDLAKLDAAENTAVVESLDEVQRAGRRARDLVNQILVFSRTRSQDRVPLRLGPVIEETVNLLRSTLPEGVTVSLVLPSEEHPVLADPTQIHQVVMNLGVNAGYALGETGGIIRVTVAPAEVDDGAFPAAPGLRPGLYMLLAVSDDGPGMDQAILSRIYEPFFSTKAPGKGTGLGLAVVHSIVRNHEGAIAVESAPGTGTTFKVYFPVDLAAESPQAPTAPA
jgi:signal transduction histidine kinase